MKEGHTDPLGMKHKLKINLQENNLVFGDCKDWLPFVPTEVDLIYIDPPFYSGKPYEFIWGNGYERRCFDDRRKGGIQHYINWMRDRLIIAHKKLKKTGSILLHCDHHANHHLRILLDEIFGEENFVNEIIWSYGSGGNTKRRFSRKHDNIYWYSKSKNKHTFNFKDIAETRGTKKRNNMKRNVDQNGKVFFSIKSNGKIYEYYEDEKLCPSDVLNISHLQQKDPERIGYPTQKPKKLIRKLIKGLSNEKDVVLDFMGGGGTTARVCAEENRRFIIGDVSPVAYRVMIDRLKEIDCRPVKVNPPLTREEWLNINDKEFERKICMFQGWIHNASSKPVDGWVDQNKMIPVEIKNHSGNIGVKDIRNLSGCMSAEGQKKGVFVAWHFSKGCFEYVAELEKKEKKKIELVFAHTIIGELVLTKRQREEYQALYEKRVKATKQRVRVIGKTKQNKEQWVKSRKQRVQRVRKTESKKQNSKRLKLRRDKS